jgi:class 3 adenylate cyclase
MTKSLRARVLASEEFAALVDIDWRDLGEHNLRGVGGAMQVLSPPVVD